MRRALFLTGLVAVVACVALLARSWDSHTGGRAARSHEVRDLRWTEGGAQAYEFSIDLVARIRSPGMPLSRIRQQHAGTLHLRIFHVADEVLVGFQIESLRVVVGNNTEEKEVGPIEAPPFWVHFERTGELREIVFGEEATAGTRDILEETVRTFQCVVPHGVGRDWRTQETHSTGDYVADYVRIADSKLRKTKARYEEEGITVERSTGTFELSGSSWLASASIQERTAIETEEGVHIRATTVASLSALPAGTARPPATLAGTYRDALVAIEQHRRAPEPEQKRSPRQSFTREDVERTILALIASDGASAKSARKLARQLASDPKHIEVMLEPLKSERTKEGSSAALIGALGMAGTAETQEALSGILLGEQWRHADRRRAAIALAFVGEPTEQTMTSLWEAADRRGDENARDLSNTALLALGTTTGTLQARGSAAVGRNRSRLVDRLGTVADREERVIVLKALGNTRDATLTSAVASHLEDPDYAVRSASAYALRTMKDPRAAERLVERLAVEPDIGVRQALSSSLNRMDTTTPRVLELARAHIETEKDESTRYALVDLLSRHMSEVPGCRTTFMRMLRSETSSRIRKRLATALLAEAQPRKRN
ncbi:MAG: HEAT repeat domain-containing protein [Planctomycetota bacterium]